MKSPKLNELPTLQKNVLNTHKYRVSIIGGFILASPQEIIKIQQRVSPAIIHMGQYQAPHKLRLKTPIALWVYA